MYQLLIIILTMTNTMNPKIQSSVYKDLSKDQCEKVAVEVYKNFEHKAGTTLLLKCEEAVEVPI